MKPHSLICLFVVITILVYNGCSKSEEPVNDSLRAHDISYKDLAKYESESNKLVKTKKVKELILDSGEDIMGMIWDLKIYGDKFLVIDLIHSRCCYLFDGQGKLLAKIGRVGQGPGEYTMPRAGCISADQIFVVDSYRINIYKMNGEVTKTVKKPFEGICNAIYPGVKGDCFAVSYNRYNRSKNSIYHLDSDGAVINSFSQLEQVPEVFDTFAPQSGLCMKDNQIFQFFNFKQELAVFDFAGNHIENITLSSPLYTKPVFRYAKNLKGEEEEQEYRASFSQVTGLFTFSRGYITTMLNWKDKKNSQLIVEFWGDDYKQTGYCEMPDIDRILAVQDDMLITGNLDELTKLEYWEFLLPGVK